MGQRLGSLIGAIGGVLFVLLYAGELGQPAATVLRSAAVVVFIGVVWVAVVRTRGREQGPRPSRQALRTYWLCVAAEVLAIPLGAAALNALDRPSLTLIWVVFVVGAHFLPFARAFGLARLAVLGSGLIVVALVGAAFAFVFATRDEVVAAWTGVAAGVLLLGSAAVGAFPTGRGTGARVDGPAQEP